MDLAARTLLGRYQIRSQLGAGGMGEVYLAEDTKLGRNVAIKLLPLELAGDERAKKRLIREAQAAATLDHPNICSIHEVGEEGGHSFIVMQYVQGESLSSRMQSGPLEVKQALEIAVQVADALAEAHLLKIIHRDITPQNIMITLRGQAKVMDFGLAKVSSDQVVVASDAETESALTEPQMMVGTVPYMSPEQLKGEPLDARSDIFSFGAVLYEMLTGHHPFVAQSAVATISAILTVEPPPITRYTNVPAELQRIVRKCLERDKERRYSSARELLIDLRNLQSDIVSGTSAIQNLVPPRKGRRNWIYGGVALSLLVIALIAFALYKFLLRDRAKSALPAAKIVPFTTFPGSELQPTFSPDGNQIAFAWNGEKGDNYDIYIKLNDSGTPPLRLTTNPANDLYPSWSPDGRYIAFVRQAGREIGIFLVPALGGPERTLYSGTSAFYTLYEHGNALCWTPDGKYLAFSIQGSPGESNSIYLLSIDSLEKRKLTSPPSGFLGDSTPSFSPDGKTLAFFRWTTIGTADIYLTPVGDSQARRLTFDNRSGRGLAWTADGREIIFSSWVSGTGSRLWRVLASGGTPERLTVGGENAFTLAISPKGNRLAYSQEFGDTNIWRIGVSDAARRSQPVKLISSTRWDHGPQFSPDGKRIAFASARSGNMEIWLCDFEGLNPVQLTSFGDSDAGSPRWSPDGQQIAFDCSESGHREIYVVSTAGGRPRRLTEEPSDDVRPGWSKDGRWIYFGSNRGGDWQVWKTPVAGGQAIQVTQHGGREAVESADGKYVYYNKGLGIPGIWRIPAAGGEETHVLDEALQGLWVLLDRGIYFVRSNTTQRPTIEFFNVTTGQTTQIATVEKEFRLVAPSLAVSPDGQWILYAQVDSVESDIMLVENFR